MATVYCVYRHRHSGLVRSLTAPALAAGWSVHLWALDRPADELADHTRGDGPGWKLDLLNGLMAAHPPAEGSVVLSDDDVELPYGDVVALERTCRTADLDLAMPAHARDSNASYPFTLARRYRRVRLTSYVESGPMLVVGPAGRDRFLPLPTGLEMGWGVELVWAAEVDRGARLGIVDAVPVRHLGTVSADYDRARAQADLDARVAAGGLTALTDTMRTHATWWRWQRKPPWRHRFLAKLTADNA